MSRLHETDPNSVWATISLSSRAAVAHHILREPSESIPRLRYLTPDHAKSGNVQILGKYHCTLWDYEKQSTITKMANAPGTRERTAERRGGIPEWNGTPPRIARSCLYHCASTTPGDNLRGCAFSILRPKGWGGHQRGKEGSFRVGQFAGIRYETLFARNILPIQIKRSLCTSDVLLYGLYTANP